MSKLCNTCSQITVSNLSDRQDLGDGVILYGFEHYGAFKQVLSSAATCPLCATVVTAMQAKGQVILPEENVINDPSAIRLVGFPLPTVDADGKAVPAKLSSILAGNAFMRGWLSIYTTESK
jgi:hypothetical protein